MKTLAIHKLMLVAVLLPLSMAVWADFNPETPNEPQAYFRLVTEVSPVGSGSSSGSGSYLEGSVVTLHTSPNDGYNFSHWKSKRTGQTISTSQSFQYTTGNRTDTIVAVYLFNPNTPSEPEASNKYHLYLSSNMPGACSFNRVSGAKVEVDETVYVEAYISNGYDFLGWFMNGLRVSTTTSFSLMMPAHTANLQAMLKFNPATPDEPGSSITSSLGDINQDGTVNVMDATALIGAYLNNTTNQLDMTIADVNHDGVINVMDATEIINIYLNNR